MSIKAAFTSFLDMYEKLLKAAVTVLIYLSGAGILAMIGVTFLQILMRYLRVRFIGTEDLVQIAGLVSIAAAMPYTTAVNAHVAIEFFFHKLSHRGRIVLGSILKILTILLFGFTARQCLIYAWSLKKNNQVTMTLHFPMYIMMYIISICLAIVVGVLLYTLLRPGKDLMKP